MSTPAQAAQLLQGVSALRNRCRTDLLFLCNKVLGYKDVHELVHNPIIVKLQQFPGGTDAFSSTGKFEGYTSAVPWPYDLPSARRRLFLDPRGFLKTTVITVAHTIQWIINYPDIRIILFHAKNEIVQQIVSELRSHFQYNTVFRELFPEHCPPPRKAAEFGNLSQFVSCARKNRTLKEPTVFGCSIEAIVAGMHAEVLKFCDIVDKENVRTPEALRQVNANFSSTQFLLDEPARSWIDVEGTTYDYRDVYNQILAAEEPKPEDKRMWLLHRRGIMDAAGEPVWERPVPGRSKCFPLDAIRKLRDDPTMDSFTFSCQYMNQPISEEGAVFSAKKLQWLPINIIKAVSRRYHATVDLASVDPMRGVKGTEDFTVVTVAGFDDMNRAYICDMARGRLMPEEIVDTIFKLYDRWHCDFQIEDAAGARQIIPWLRREMMKREKWPLLSTIKRDNRTSKKERIRGLRPWINSGDIRFADNLPHREHLILEFERFSDYSSWHDDILDTVADQLQNRTNYGPAVSKESYGTSRPWWIADDPFEGFEPRISRSGVDPKTGM